MKSPYTFLQSPPEIAQSIAERAKQRRIQHNITQKQLVERSGVSLGSIKRFEQQGEISLKNLILIAFALGATKDFAHLFEEPPFRTTDDVIRAYQRKTRHRARPKKNPCDPNTP